MKKRVGQKKSTLCWGCEKAGGKCSWSKSFTPVDGWDAIPTKIQTRDNPNGYIDSFRVIECPEFELLELIETNEKEKIKWYKLIMDSKGEDDGI